MIRMRFLQVVLASAAILIQSVISTEEAANADKAENQRMADAFLNLARAGVDDNYIPAFENGVSYGMTYGKYMQANWKLTAESPTGKTLGHIFGKYPDAESKKVVDLTDKCTGGDILLLGVTTEAASGNDKLILGDKESTGEWIHKISAGMGTEDKQQLRQSLKANPFVLEFKDAKELCPGLEANAAHTAYFGLQFVPTTDEVVGKEGYDTILDDHSKVWGQTQTWERHSSKKTDNDGALQDLGLPGWDRHKIYIYPYPTAITDSSDPGARSSVLNAQMLLRNKKGQAYTGGVRHLTYFGTVVKGTGSGTDYIQPVGAIEGNHLFEFNDAGLQKLSEVINEWAKTAAGLLTDLDGTWDVPLPEAPAPSDNIIVQSLADSMAAQATA
eukprot:GHVU01180218.1.p1 GENE.GHVU01180218.1~~GHVU01180218.1.p1  ORF type:complete len:386 (-),score=40.81 GHVU01180218.1:1222-2379(-)